MNTAHVPQNSPQAQQQANPAPLQAGTEQNYYDRECDKKCWDIIRDCRELCPDESLTWDCERDCSDKGSPCFVKCRT
ncbi:MAG: hypothetical protein Q8R70_00540 [Methanoregula sp.]|nr:hypothetical protein [Methanoregula sp.]